MYSPQPKTNKDTLGKKGLPYVVTFVHSHTCLHNTYVMYILPIHKYTNSSAKMNWVVTQWWQWSIQQDQNKNVQSSILERSQYGIGEHFGPLNPSHYLNGGIWWGQLRYNFSESHLCPKSPPNPHPPTHSLD